VSVITEILVSGILKTNIEPNQVGMACVWHILVLWPKNDSLKVLCGRVVVVMSCQFSQAFGPFQWLHCHKYPRTWR